MASQASADHDEQIQAFSSLTGAPPADAFPYLEASSWNLDAAVSEYYTAQEEGSTAAQIEPQDQPEAEPYTGPRTLDGRPAPDSTTASSASARSRAPQAAGRKGGIATLGSLDGGSGGSRRPHAHDDDDDDDDGDFTPPEGQPRDLFAGGEKSGLAVQDPHDPRRVVNDIITRAKANAARPGGEPTAPSRFQGAGQTLGGDDAPSQVIPDPQGPRVSDAPPVTRALHIWNDGFSVEDGPLRRFDDPAHAADLRMIRAGRAPLHLMGVQPDQAIDVQLNEHDENYKPPPKVYKPFSGAGNRLGSPVPGGASTTTAGPTSSTTTSAPSSSTTTNAAASPSAPELDPNQPTIALRIQLADGTRLPARFNAHHTIGDVYDFIARAMPSAAPSSRSWVLATTFPNREHTDKALTLGEVPEFQRGGTAVQKWV